MKNISRILKNWVFPHKSGRPKTERGIQKLKVGTKNCGVAVSLKGMAGEPRTYLLFYTVLALVSFCVVSCLQDKSSSVLYDCLPSKS